MIWSRRQKKFPPKKERVFWGFVSETKIHCVFFVVLSFLSKRQKKIMDKDRCLVTHDIDWLNEKLTWIHPSQDIIKLYNCVVVDHPEQDEQSFSVNGIKLIIEAVKANKFKWLILSHCRIDDDAVKALAKGISECPQLKRLDLSQNIFGTDGVKALFSALSEVTLFEIDLTGYLFDPEEKNIIHNFLKTNSSIKVFKLDYFGNEGLAKIIKYFFMKQVMA